MRCYLISLLNNNSAVGGILPLHMVIDPKRTLDHFLSPQVI